MKIFIDPGHNYSGGDTGATGNGLREQDITLVIAKRLKELLTQAGHTVKMSRNNITDNVGKTLSESINTRAKMSNTWGADLFVSVHTNAFNKKAYGTETLVYSKTGNAYEIAKRVQKAIVTKLDTNDRGVKERPDLGVLRLTNAPALLVETAFIDNPADAQKLSYKSNEFAVAIFEGITNKTVKKEIDSVNDIVSELSKRGILTDAKLWTEKLTTDQNAYWLARKTVKFLIDKNV
jgi:N-acetylmuramoyl-L-alanine amidase